MIFSMTKKSLNFLAIGGIVAGICFLAFLAFAGNALAQNVSNIEFPITDLGNCASEEECKTFCDDPANVDSCVTWAESHGMQAERPEAPVPEKGGPGGCTSKEECRAYCEGGEHVDECLDFAVSHGHMTADQAEKIKANQNKSGPGGCKSDKEYRTFCSDSANVEECTSFAVREGHMTAEQAQQMKTFLTRGPGGGRNLGRGPEVRNMVIDEEKAKQVLQEAGEGPGGCASFEECGAYCETAGHEDECFNFAKEHELVKPEDIEKFKKLTTIVGPGGCHGRECKTYCENSEHRDECFDFAKANDLIPHEELERVEKMREIGRKVEERGGPGGCRGEGECRTYCSGADHFDECAAFAVSEGFLSPEEAQGSLREFIELEHFGPEGFGPPEGVGPGEFPGGPGGFPGRPGFPGQGFGPGSEDGFPPGFENIPDDAVRARVEEQFKSRFEQFKELRGQFDRGEIPERRLEEFGGGDEHNIDGVGPVQARFPMLNRFFPRRGEEQKDFPREGGFPPQGEFQGGEFPGREGVFPPPGEFPGMNRGEGESGERGEFHGNPPGGMFPTPQDFPPNFEGSRGEFMQPEQMGPREERIPQEFHEGTLPPFEREFEQRTDGFVPPPPGGDPVIQIHNEGSFTPPPSGNFDGGSTVVPSSGYFSQPPPSGSFDGGGTFVPPPSGDFSQPPPPPPSESTPPPPTSLRGADGFFANILSMVNPALR